MEVTMAEPNQKYETAKDCLKAAKDAQSTIRHTKFEQDRWDIMDYSNEAWGSYDHKYTIEPYSNTLVGKDVVTDEKGELLIKSTFRNKEGYTCCVYQKQSDDAITQITVNRPNGNDETEVRLSPSALRYDMVKDKSITPFMNSMNTLVETGANLQDIYNNYIVFSTNGKKQEDALLMAQIIEEEKVHKATSKTPSSQMESRLTTGNNSSASDIALRNYLMRIR